MLAIRTDVPMEISSPRSCPAYRWRALDTAAEARTLTENDRGRSFWRQLFTFMYEFNRY
jgi:hypothetical protein